MKAIHRQAAIGLALVLMLATAAVATAAKSGNGESKSKQQQPRGHRPGGPPFLKGMTNATVNVYRDGKTVTISVDRGKVKSVADDSITITERDGQDVTIPTDGDTKVVAGPRKTKTLSDLKAGQRVTVNREEGQAAKAVALMPKRGKGRPGRGQGPGGPPPAGDSQ